MNLFCIKKTTVVLLFCLTFQSTFAQIVLDGVFVEEKTVLIEPRSVSLYFELWDYAYREDRNVQSDSNAYLASYLFAEPAFYSLRIIKYLDFEEKSNAAFTEPKTPYKHHLIGRKWVPDENPSEPWKVGNDPVYLNEREEVLAMIGTSKGRLDSSKNAHNQAGQLMRESVFRIRYWEREGRLGYDEAGKLIRKQAYQPDSMRAISFYDLLVESILIEGTLTAYKKRDFAFPLTSDEVRSNLQRAEASVNRVRGIRIMEDYFLNQQTGVIDSRIIGIGCVGQDQTPGEELFWVYYPELRWCMNEQVARRSDGFYNYEWIWDHHLYTCTIEERIPIGSTNMTGIMKNDCQYLVDLDLLTEIELMKEEYGYLNQKLEGDIEWKTKNGYTLKVNLEEGKANGEVSHFYPGGQLRAKGTMVKGKREGEMQVFFESSQLKAIRRFENNLGQGEQESYWPNGKLYARFQLREDVIEQLERYYQDGMLMEKGSFQNGVLQGDWQHNLVLSDAVGLQAQKHNYGKYVAGFDGEKTFQLRARYTHSTPDDESRECVTYGPVCFKSEWISD